MTDSNPAWLPPGLTVEQLSAAIKRSGYPLQTIVASKLREKFEVQEEWGFSDRASGEYRTIDIMADYFDWSTATGERVRAHGTLIIECKRSDLPFIFFLCDPGAVRPTPVVAGLRHEYVTLSTDDSRSKWLLSPLDALDLSSDGYIVDVPVCATFSKCVRKGSAVELSGSDVYNGVVQPLMSAVAHFQEASAPVKTAAYFDAHLTMPVAVVDAPMVGVEVVGSEAKIEPLNWVRILRHEPEKLGKFAAHRGRLSGIDVVSAAYFDQYVSDQFMPFYERFHGRVRRHGKELATGKGFAAKLGSMGLRKISERLRPR
jgi:hypothetical protein